MLRKKNITGVILRQHKGTDISKCKFISVKTAKSYILV